MSFDVLSSPWLPPLDGTAALTTPVSTSASTTPTPSTSATANPWTPIPATEDPGLQALMRDWILQALTAAPMFAEPSPFAATSPPAGGGLGLESLATAYDYDSFAGEGDSTPSYLLADGSVVTSKQLDLLI